MTTTKPTVTSVLAPVAEPGPEQLLERATPERASLRVAVAGDVDHGKSTLLGRLLIACQAISADRIEAAAGDLAALLDALVEEREGKFTLDSTEVNVERAGRSLTFIDVPGHFDLLKNMATGASRADVGVLLVDATISVTDQTRRHMQVLAILGISRLVCVASKMDLVDFSQGTYDEVAAAVKMAAMDAGVELVAVVPLSAAEDIGVDNYGNAPPWCTGPSLLELIDGLDSEPSLDQGPVRFIVQGRFDAGDQHRIFGRLESGTLHQGMHLVDDCGEHHRVEEILRFGESAAESCGPGSSPALALSSAPVSAGAVLGPPDDPPKVSIVWHARILGLRAHPLSPGDEVVVRLGTARTTGRVTSLTNRLSTSTSGELGFGEFADVRLDLDEAIPADRASHCYPLGRFLVTDPTGSALGIGIVEAFSERAEPVV